MLSIFSVRYLMYHRAGDTGERGGSRGAMPPPPPPPAPLFCIAKRKKETKEILSSVPWPLHLEIHFAGPVSVCSAQPKIFVNACVFDIIQLDNMSQNFFNCSYHSSTSLQARIIEP